MRPPETGNGPPPRARPGNHQPPPSRRTAPDYGQGSSPAVKRSAAEFWRLYHAYCDGTRGGSSGDPANACVFGCLDFDRDLTRFELPEEVVASWRRAADAYEAFVGYVALFDELDGDHWCRWHTLRRASPGVARDQLKPLLGTLDGVETETLTAVCATVQGVAA